MCTLTSKSDVHLLNANSHQWVLDAFLSLTRVCSPSLPSGMTRHQHLGEDILGLSFLAPEPFLPPTADSCNSPSLFTSLPLSHHHGIGMLSLFFSHLEHSNNFSLFWVSKLAVMNPFSIFGSDCYLEKYKSDQDVFHF